MSNLTAQLWDQLVADGWQAVQGQPGFFSQPIDTDHDALVDLNDDKAGTPDEEFSNHYVRVGVRHHGVGALMADFFPERGYFATAAVDVHRAVHGKRLPYSDFDDTRGPAQFEADFPKALATAASFVGHHGLRKALSGAAEAPAQPWIPQLLVELHFGWSDHGEALLDRVWDHEKNFRDQVLEFETRLRAHLGQPAPAMRELVEEPRGAAPVDTVYEGYMLDCRDLGLQIMNPRKSEVREQIELARSGQHQFCSLQPLDNPGLLDSMASDDGTHGILLTIGDIVHVGEVDYEGVLAAFDTYGQGGADALFPAVEWTTSDELAPGSVTPMVPRTPEFRRAVHHEVTDLPDDPKTKRKRWLRRSPKQ